MNTIKLHTITSGWSSIYNEGSQVIISPKNIVFLSLKIGFIIANSADPDEMLHNAAFHLGLHCLTEYPFRWGIFFLQRVKELFGVSHPAQVFCFL